MSAEGPLIASTSLLIEQPIDCKITGEFRKVEIFFETLNEFSCLLKRTSLIPACLGVDGRFVITSIQLQFFVLQSQKLGKPAYWKPCWIYMMGKMIPFPYCWILQGKLELWKSLLMQSILTTTTRVRETVATVNTPGAKTEDGVRQGSQAVFSMRPCAWGCSTPKFQCVINNQCICARAVFC